MAHLRIGFESSIGAFERVGVSAGIVVGHVGTLETLMSCDFREAYGFMPGRSSAMEVR
jgi:hypothetical protein